ncbi:hypothetical protein D3C81_1633660 [compost metagenome]
MQGWRVRWPATDDVDLGVQGSQRCTNAGDHAAATYRHENRIKVWGLFEQFDPYGALAGNDVCVVVGRNEGFALHRRLACGFQFHTQRIKVQADYFCAEGAHGIQLVSRG